MSRMSIEPARVVNINRVAEDIYYLRVEPLFGVKSVEPFNFFMVWIPRTDEIPLSIAYTDGNSYSFLFKVKGIGTQTLSRVSVGQFVGLKGPLGRGFTIDNATKRVLVIAGGIGIAPVPLFIHRSRYKKLDLVWGVRRKEELFDIHMHFPWLKERYNLIVATEDCSYGICGTVLDALDKLEVGKYDTLIAIGPTTMLWSICKSIGNGITTEVYIALETMVKCGVGLCGSCYIKSSDKLLCTDGPVFKCNEVIEHLRKSIVSEGLR